MRRRDRAALRDGRRPARAGARALARAAVRILLAPPSGNGGGGFCPRRHARARLRAVRRAGPRRDHDGGGTRTTSASARSLLTVAYSIGAAVPMLAIAYGGREAAARTEARGHASALASGVVIAARRDRARLPRRRSPRELRARATRRSCRTSRGARRPPARAREGARRRRRRSPPCQTVTAASPTTASPRRSTRTATGSTRSRSRSPKLRGKVVLIDFWTYSCINCLRTLPHLKAWYAAYHAKAS